MHNNYLKEKGSQDVYPTSMPEANQMLSLHRPIRLGTDKPSGPIDNERSFATKGTTLKSKSKSGAKDKQSVSDASEDSNSSASNQLHPKWKNRTCIMCGKNGHPPYPRYCKVIRAIAKDPGLQSKLRAASKSHSSGSSAGSSNKKPAAKQRASKTKSKPKSKSSKQKAMKDFQKQQQKQFAQFMNYIDGSSESDPSPDDNSSDTSSDDESGYGFAQYHVPSSNHRSGGKRKSGKNSRSGRASPPSVPFLDYPRLSSNHSESSATKSDPDTDMDGNDNRPWVEVVRNKRITPKRK